MRARDRAQGGVVVWVQPIEVGESKFRVLLVLFLG